MDIFLTLVFWAITLLIALYFAQLIIGLVIWFVIGVVWLVTFPVIWGYKKLKKEEA